MAFERDHDVSPGWDLSAPSSQVLLTGAATPNMWAIKLALKELVLRRAVELQRVRRRRFLISSVEVDVLSLGKWPGQGTERPLVGVMEAFPKSVLYRVGSGGVPIGTVAKEVNRWYRAGGGYVNAEVLPALEYWGYYRRVSGDDGAQWQLTPDGERKLEELRALLETGRLQFPLWVQQDRDQAAAYVNRAGAATLLLGNPAFWLWTLLTVLLAGEAVGAEGIPPTAGSPFPVPPLTPQQQDQKDSADGPHSELGNGDTDAVGHQTPPAESGGGGGGFDSPGETIDAAIGGDGEGGGDGE